MPTKRKTWTNKKVVCPVCNNSFGNNNIKKHTTVCEYIETNIKNLTKDFFILGSVEKVAKKYKICSKLLSSRFKSHKVPVNSDENGKFKRLHNVNDDFFDNMKEEQFWLLGLLAADGYIKGNVVTLSQSGDEGRKIIEYINKLLSNENKMRDSNTSNEISYSLYFSSSKITKLLREFGIIENKTKKLKFPNVPKKYLKDFIRGYIDGDGSLGIYKTNSNSNYIVASFVGTPDFINKAQELIPIIGNDRDVKHSTVRELRWYGEKCVNFCEWLYESDSVYKSYKYDIYKHFISHYTPQYLRYKPIKEKAKKLFLANKKPSEIIKETKISSSTFYKWKREWQNGNT